MTLTYLLYHKAVVWPFGDWVFSREYDWFADVSKARRFGFQEMIVDTHEMFVRMIHQVGLSLYYVHNIIDSLFPQLQEERIIPSFKN